MNARQAVARWLVLALMFTWTMGIALPAAALSNTDWTKRAYSDVLLRDPTAQELGSAVTALSGGATRFQVAYGILSSQEYYHDLVGANPAMPGWFQTLLGRNPSAQEVSYFDCLRSQGAQDETIIAALIGGESIVGTCRPPSQTITEYQARAIAIEPGLAMCTRDEPVINQIYVDLLGRNATPAELLATVSDTLELILDPLSNAATADEYRSKVVNGAFLRFLHRLPRTTLGTSPDPNKSELEYYLDVLVAQQAISGNLGDEALDALLMATPEYDAGTGPTLGGTFILSQFVSPVLANPLVVAINQNVVSLSQKVLSQQQTIDALVIADFGGGETADAASAELSVAADKIAQVRAILGSQCLRNAACALLQNADETLQAGYRAVAAGNTRAAAFDAQRAYYEAALALRIGKG